VDHKALSALILRIAGLLIVVFTITNAAKNLDFFFSPSTPQGVSVWPMLAATLVSVGLPVLVGLLLVYFPSAIATRVLKVQGADVNVDDIKALQCVAFSTLGLWLTLYAVVEAVYYWAKARLYLQYIAEMRWQGTLPPMQPDDFGGLVSCAVQLVFGIWLLVGNRGLVNVLARLRG
jgi:hypothetical protein